jgi:DNA polymerase-3 subunit delta'
MWQTIGQHKTLELLERSIKNNELSHAYLITGPPHVGKMTLALELTQAINCEGDQPPCKECQPCHKIANRKHADVMIIDDTESSPSDSKTNLEIGKDEIKALQHSASLPPYEGKYKVFIINRAENLSHEAANRLLKTLEEPPPHVIIILVTSNDLLVLPTITSRCQRLELRPLPLEQITKLLTSSYKVDNQKARLVAGLSQGCPGWAINAVLDNALLTQRAQFIEDMLALLETTWNERFAYAAKLGDNKRLAEEILKSWLSCWRDIMLIKYNCKEKAVNSDYLEAFEELCQKLTSKEVENFIDSLNQSLGYITTNANLRLVLEVTLLNMPKIGKNSGG